MSDDAGGGNYSLEMDGVLNQKDDLEYARRKKGNDRALDIFKRLEQSFEFVFTKCLQFHCLCCCAIRSLGTPLVGSLFLVSFSFLCSLLVRLKNWGIIQSR